MHTLTTKEIFFNISRIQLYPSHCNYA